MSNNEQGSLKEEVNARSKEYLLNTTGILFSLYSIFTRRREDAKDREECKMLNGIWNNEQGSLKEEVNARSKEDLLNTMVILFPCAVFLQEGAKDHEECSRHSLLAFDAQLDPTFIGTCARAQRFAASLPRFSLNDGVWGEGKSYFFLITTEAIIEIARRKEITINEISIGIL
jgi:hypothetical protein